MAAELRLGLRQPSTNFSIDYYSMWRFDYVNQHIIDINHINDPAQLEFAKGRFRILERDPVEGAAFHKEGGGF